MTIKQWLQELASSNTSDEHDANKLQNLLHKLNFPQAVITCGVAYLEGRGTIDFPPMSIQSLAKMLIDIDNR